MPQTLTLEVSRDDVAQAVRLVVDSMTGEGGEARYYADAAYAGMAVEFFSLVKGAFVVKARGGTDEAGISWPPLSKKYLAYGRGPKSSRRVGGHSPQGGDGALTKAQVDKWWVYYRQALAWLATTEPIKAAKGHAAAIAWSKIKKEGGRTKLMVLGNRPHEILRDRGILLNSLTPGFASGDRYIGTEHQIYRTRPGEITVGTNVPYANAHHEGIGVPKRQLWPDADKIPDSWWVQILAPATEQIINGVAELLERRAQ